MATILVGFNHHTAPIEVRERFSIGDADLPVALAALRRRGLDEVVVLSTCNRLEVVAQCADGATGVAAVTAYLSEAGDTAYERLDKALYRKEGGAVARHLFRVASGLDSLILGEAQIMGQVADALKSAHAAGASGSVLFRLFTSALHVGKRARAETGISRHTLSISHAAVQLIIQQTLDLRSKRVLIVGAGEMAGLAMSTLAQHGVGSLHIVNRTSAAAQALATRFGAQAADWDSLAAELLAADVVVSAADVAQPIICADDFAPLARERAPLLVDIGVPRTIERRVREVDGVRLYDIDDLQEIVADHRELRQQEVAQVEAIVTQEVERFQRWLRSRQIVPVIHELRQKADEIAEAEIEHALRRLPELDAREREVVAQMAHRIVNKLLHTPTVALKSRAARGEHRDYEHATRQLFALRDRRFPDEDASDNEIEDGGAGDA